MWPKSYLARQPCSERLCKANIAYSCCCLRATGVNWLAAAAWNAAISAQDANLYEDTAVLLLAAGKFYAATPLPDATVLQNMMVCQLSIVACMPTASEAQQQGLCLHGCTEQLLMELLHCMPVQQDFDEK